MGEGATVGSSAAVFGSARVFGAAEVFGTAWVFDSAAVSGTARVYGTARVFGSARVFGAGDIAKQSHVAWVDRVGSGSSITLHRVRLDGGFGWRINAGCKHWEAATVEGVIGLVRDNLDSEPVEWSDRDEGTRVRWTCQVHAALLYLSTMVED